MIYYDILCNRNVNLLGKFNFEMALHQDCFMYFDESIIFRLQDNQIKSNSTFLIANVVQEVRSSNKHGYL